MFGEGLDLHAYWRTIVARRWIVISVFVAAIVVTGILTLRATRIYDATCTIIIDLAAPRVLEKDVQDVVETGTGTYWFTREYYETQYRVITSRAVAQRVADRLQLAVNHKFLGDVEEGEAAAKAPVRREPVAILQKNLKVEPVKDSRIVKIRYEDPDPELAAMIANAFAESYVSETLAVRSSATASASDWLEQQLAQLERKLDESGRALFDFKKSHDIVSSSWEDRQSMVSQRLTVINEALTRARVRKAELQARAEMVRALGPASAGLDARAESLPQVAGSQAIQTAKLRYVEAKAECEALQIRYLPEHPQLKACVTRLASAKQAIDDQIKTTLESVRKEYDEIATTERNMVALLDQAKSDAFGLNQFERDYLELKRAYDNNQRLYDLVLKRLKDTGVTGMLQASNVRILDRARPSPIPARPRPIQNLLIALVLGVLGGVGLALAAEQIDTTITTQEQIESRVGLTFLGVIPRIERASDGSAQDLVVHTHPRSAAAECVRSVRTNLLFMSPDEPLRTILVTSSGPGEGKTTTATSLAITMAGSGSRVLLVDADMRRPRLHRIFGVANGAGLSSLLIGDPGAEVGDPIHETMVPNLSVLPSGPIPPNPAELLHRPAFNALLASLYERFDRIIIDSPPIGVVADAVVTSTHAHGVLLVVRLGKSSRDGARRAVRQLRDVNARVLGAVLNDLDLQRNKYGGYAYYYQYGYYDGGSATAQEKAAASSS